MRFSTLFCDIAKVRKAPIFFFRLLVRLPKKFAWTEYRNRRLSGKIQQVVVVSNEGVYLACYSSGQHFGVFGVGRHLDPHGTGVALDDFRRLYETLQEFSVLRLSYRAVYNKVILTPQGRTTYGT